MAYQPLNIFNKDPSLAITLYTAPLNNQKKIFKEPVDIFAHWAICIRGICYELRRGIKENNEPKYVYKPIAEQDWIKMKIDQKRYPRPAYPGHMCRPYSSETINEVGKCRLSRLVESYLPFQL
jgi:hypothetical protein